MDDFLGSVKVCCVAFSGNLRHRCWTAVTDSAYDSRGLRDLASPVLPILAVQRVTSVGLVMLCRSIRQGYNVNNDLKLASFSTSDGHDGKPAEQSLAKLSEPPCGLWIGGVNRRRVTSEARGPAATVRLPDAAL